MKYPIILSFLISSFLLEAQIKPDFFPEDVIAESLNPRCYCKPGVKNKSRSKGIVLSYGGVKDGSFNADEIPLTGSPSRYKQWQNIEASLKIPLVNKDNFKVLIGYKYYTELFNFESFGPDYKVTFNSLNEEPLKSNSFSLYITKPLNEKNYIGGRFRLSTNGNYNGWLKFGEDYNIYKFLGVYGVKPNENLEWGIGVGISKSFRRTNVIPFFIYNRTINERWGIESALPGFIYGRYNLNPFNILLAGVEYGSKSFRLKVDRDTADPFDYAFNHSEILISSRWEHRFAPWIWGNLKFGYRINFTTEFESKSDITPSFELDPNSGMFFNIGLFVSPPDKFLK